MLEVYRRYLGVLTRLRPVLAAVERRDADLGRQFRRAACSVALNLSEGSGSEGGTRRQRYLTALGSARETVACVEVAVALGYLEEPAALLRELGGVVGTLVVLAVGKGQRRR
jgi:four helix bundle protein